MILRQHGIAAAAAWIAGLCLLVVGPSTMLVSSFQPASRIQTIQSPFSPSFGRPKCSPPVNPCDNHRSSRESITSLNMFMGSDGGLFGIGTPELATILLVGYFVLGPSDLYKLVKEIGKFIQNVRTLGNEATKSFENSMESQLELQELRKAQRELNDAFSFRRSINVDEGGEAFSTNAQSPRPQDDIGAPVAAAAATASAGGEAAEQPPKRKKKRRRIKKKKVQPEPDPALAMEAAEAPINNVPDLDMSDAFPEPATTAKKEEKDDWFADGDGGKDFDFPSASDMAKEDLEWLKDSKTTTTPAASEAPIVDEKDAATESAEQNRFQQQLSSNWNQQVLDNEDKLAPLALIMEKLALLEEEKAAADKRLEDEFRRRFEQEEDFYQRKRELLEETASKVQQDAYVTMDSGSTKK